MRVAVLSDIHGNILALEAVLADLAAQGGADLIVVAGDLCLDGPRPREALARVVALDCPVVQGNTDRDLALSTTAIDGSARGELLRWTREQLGAEGLDYLRTLPFSHRIPAPDGVGAVLVVHANPQNLDDPLRPNAPEAQLAPLLAEVAPEVTTIVFGHLHLPFVRQVGRLTLVDVASVGLPKDGDRRAGYGLLTWADGGWSVEQRRVEYPVEAVVAQLQEADLPGVDELVKALLRARYPNMTTARGGRAPARQAVAPTNAPALPDLAQPIPAPLPDPNPAPEPSLIEATAPAWEPPLPVAVSVGDAQPSETNGAEAGGGAVAPDSEAAATAAGLLTELDADAIGVAEAESDGGSHAVEAFALAPGAEREVDQEAAMVVEPDGAMPGVPRKPKKKKKRKVEPEVEIVELVAGEPLAAALPAILQRRLDAVLSFVDGVEADTDPEAVHDMRVATRRLRAALDVAEPFFGAKEFKRAARRVRTLARSLGTVRDSDVLLGALRERHAAASPEERVGLEGLLDRISADRAGTRADVDPVLDRWGEGADSYAADFRQFAAQARLPKSKLRDRDLTGAVAAHALDGRLDAFEERAAIFDEAEGGDSEAFHELRIVAKQLRYTIELFAPILGDDVGALLKDLRSLQEQLGTMHDSDVLTDLLAWERAGALERQLHMLEFATFNPGSRAERLGMVREYLHAPDSFAGTALGIYGLLIDVGDERDRAEVILRERWAALEAERFVPRLRALAEVLQHPEAPEEPAVVGTDASTADEETN